MFDRTRRGKNTGEGGERVSFLISNESNFRILLSFFLKVHSFFKEETKKRERKTREVGPFFLPFS